jgi:acyl-CoA thioesterase-1
MEAPPNLGEKYTGAFRAMYQEVASAEGLTLVPFLLERVAGVDTLNQADGIHPNEAGERVVADNVWRVLAPVLRTLDRSEPTG